MSRAGEYALNRSVRDGYMSYGTAATVSDRWDRFTDWLKEQGEAKRMEDIRRDAVIRYGSELAERVREGELSAAYAQNLVSAVNTVMDLATRGSWDSVSPTKEAGIDQRSHVRTDPPPAMDRESFDRAMESMRNSGMERQASIAELARNLGLRSEEASLLDAKSALKQATTKGEIRVDSGTKGGRPRTIKITDARQIATLERAAAIQGNHHSMIPSEMNWKQWREGPLRAGREAVQSLVGGRGYHDLRAAYACERYHDLTGRDAPVFGGGIEDRESDREARQQIAEELGHGREDVASSYVGGKR
jgi:hypothetical protein